MSEKNVANFIVIPFAAPAVAATVLELYTEGNGNLVNCHVSNSLESGGDITIKMQEKETGGSYADVAGTTHTLKPGGAAVFAAPVEKYFQFVASGVGYGEIRLSTDVRTQHLTQLP